MKLKLPATLIFCAFIQNAFADSLPKILQADRFIDIGEVQFTYREDDYRDQIEWDFDVTNISAHPIRRIDAEIHAFNDRPVPIAKLSNYQLYEIAGGLLPEETITVRGEINIDTRLKNLNVKAEELRAEIEIEDILDANSFSLLCKLSISDAKYEDVQANRELFGASKGASLLTCGQ